MTLGAEPKKVAILGVLVIGIAGVYIYNSSSGDSSAPAPVSAPRLPVSSAPAPGVVPARRTNASGRVEKGEFHPVVHNGSKSEDSAPDTIDPQLRLDLIAKVQAVEMTEAGRNLFQFGTAPPPPTAIPAVPKGIQQIPIAHPVTTAPPPPPQPTGPPPPPPVTPLTFKYYGILVSKLNGRKQAFLQDGDDIFFAQENELVKKRYRIVKIAPTSIDVEDTQAKNTQTLKLQDIPPS